MLWFFLVLTVICQSLAPFHCSIWQPGNLLFNNKYQTLEYNEHYHAFEVRKQLRPKKVLKKQEMLATYMPSHSVKPYGRHVRNGALFVALRFMIPDD